MTLPTNKLAEEVLAIPDQDSIAEAQLILRADRVIPELRKAIEDTILEIRTALQFIQECDPLDTLYPTTSESYFIPRRSWVAGIQFA